MSFHIPKPRPAWCFLVGPNFILFSVNLPGDVIKFFCHQAPAAVAVMGCAPTLPPPPPPFPFPVASLLGLGPCFYIRQLVHGIRSSNYATVIVGQSDSGTATAQEPSFVSRLAISDVL